MPELQRFPLQTTSGKSGYVLRASRFLDRTQTNRVQLDDGTEFEVPSNALGIRPDGSFVLNDAEASDVTTSPQAPEPQRQTGEQANHEPETRTTRGDRPTLVDEPLFSDDVSVERVPVNRIIDGPMDTRHEGDTTIIPVLEEVVTVQKRLLLREEVRITRRRTVLREPRHIVVSDGETRVVGADGRNLEPSR